MRQLEAPALKRHGNICNRLHCTVRGAASLCSQTASQMALLPFAAWTAAQGLAALLKRSKAMLYLLCMGANLEASSEARLLQQTSRQDLRLIVRQVPVEGTSPHMHRLLHCSPFPFRTLQPEVAR